FEFLDRVTIGQYIPGVSPLHRMDPRARLAAALLLLGAATFAPHPGGLALALLVALTAITLSNLPWSFLLRGLVPPLPFLLFLALIQVFFNTQENQAPLVFWWGVVQIYASDLIAAGMLVLRFVVLILGISLVSLVTSTSEMIYGVDALLKPLRWLRIPTQDLTMMAQITLRFIPFMALTAERIVKAQASRGVDWSSRPGNLLQRARRILPLLVPLFVSSLGKAERMALAMDARGYGSTRRRSMMMATRWTWADTVAVVACAVLAVAIILL
ncbi:energy-coupling factor transporter transmembrane protein EcfT, partial [bacterium]